MSERGIRYTGIGVCGINLISLYPYTLYQVQTPDCIEDMYNKFGKITSLGVLS